MSGSNMAGSVPRKSGIKQFSMDDVTQSAFVRLKPDSVLVLRTSEAEGLKFSSAGLQIHELRGPSDTLKRRLTADHQPGGSGGVLLMVFSWEDDLDTDSMTASGGDQGEASSELLFELQLRHAAPPVSTDPQQEVTFLNLSFGLKIYFTFKVIFLQ